jgi:hypothetical protein
MNQVVVAGAYGLPSLANHSSEILALLKKAYRDAVRDVFIFAAAAGGLALVFSLGFEHRNIKKVADHREKTRSSNGGSLQKQADQEIKDSV